MSGEVTWQGAGAQSFKAQDIEQRVEEARTAVVQEIGANEGVTASAITNNNRPSLWKPGQSGNPAGRPRKEQETAVLNVLRERVTPEEVVDNIIGLLRHSSSWRAKESGIRLYLEYTVGKPVQRIIEDGDSLDVFLARLRSG